MRCWIIACVSVLAICFWATTQHTGDRSAWHQLGVIGSVWAGVLLLSSLACFFWSWRRACVGLFWSILTLLDIGKQLDLCGRVVESVVATPIEAGSQVAFRFEGGRRLVFSCEHDVTKYAA